MSEYKQNYMRSIVYEAITRLLPAMGRDFRVRIEFIDDNHMNIGIDDITPLGTAVKRALMMKLNETIKTVQKEKEEEYGRKTDSERPADPPAASPPDASASGDQGPSAAAGSAPTSATADSGAGAGDAPAADNGYDH